ncbi:hypothetical protein RFI_06056 [Reticulomyxa filosa]|uniref:Actin n=1 Tax=Reticulomyxa filosa TaxID=46433 RepID=X6NYZ8_RETFI|nr:hypothetical protein RFI_06056 [Reticulomyxa filosa]|eukprot:ETO31064.1 hypothetical protein RFI_06056 [Reticulomyxa filosa]
MRAKQYILFPPNELRTDTLTTRNKTKQNKTNMEEIKFTIEYDRCLGTYVQPCFKRSFKRSFVCVYFYYYYNFFHLNAKASFFYPLQKKKYPVLLTESVDNPVRNRAAMAKTFFEAFDAPALFFAPPPVLALYASGRLTGCVLDSGHGITQCVPIYDGFALPHAITRMEVAGGDVDKYFEHLIRKLSAVTFHTSRTKKKKKRFFNWNLKKKKKKKSCELMDTRNNRAAIPTALTGRSLTQRNDEESNSIEVKLPDGKILNLGSARFRAPELLFDPSLIGLEYRGIHYCVLDSIAKADLELRRNLYQQILLSGGSTMTKEFGKRLLAELNKIVDFNKCGLPEQSTMNQEIASCTKKVSFESEEKGNNLKGIQVGTVWLFMVEILQNVRFCVTKKMKLKQTKPSLISSFPIFCFNDETIR